MGLDQASDIELRFELQFAANPSAIIAPLIGYSVEYTDKIAAATGRIVIKHVQRHLTGIKAVVAHGYIPISLHRLADLIL